MTCSSSAGIPAAAYAARVDSAQQIAAAIRPSATAVLSSSRAGPWFSGSERCRHTTTGRRGSPAWLSRPSGCSLSDRMTSAPAMARAVAASSGPVKASGPPGAPWLRPREVTGTAGAGQRPEADVVLHPLAGRLPIHLAIQAQHRVALTALMEPHHHIAVQDPGPARKESFVDRQHTQFVHHAHLTARLAEREETFSTPVICGLAAMDTRETCALVNSSFHIRTRSVTSHRSAG